MSRVVMIIAPELFRDEEYAEPRSVLESRSHDVVTASTRAGVCEGKLGMEATATLSLRDALEETWDGIVFVGGAGASVFFDDPDAHRLAREAATAGAVVSAICIAPSTLARAGLLRGVRATAFPSQRGDLAAHGAVWSEAPVVVDGRIITANGPEAAAAFGEALADALES